MFPVKFFSIVFVFIASADNGTFKIIMGIDLYGGDMYTTPLNAADAASCATSCAGITGCVGFSWNNNSHACSPKNSSTSWQLNIPWSGAVGFLNGTHAKFYNSYFR